MNLKDIKEKAEGLIVPLVEKEGFKVFGLKASYIKQGISLKIEADYDSGGISLEECAQLNRGISEYLERENILGKEFIIEVSSPGIDRDLVSLKDFKRSRGRDISLWLNTEVRGKKYHEGVLERIDEDKEAVFLSVKGESVKIPLKAVHKGREIIS